MFRRCAGICPPVLTRHAVAGSCPSRCFLSNSRSACDQLAKFAGDDGVELVQRQVDAVVGDAVLREVVGADALAAVAGADQGRAAARRARWCSRCCCRS